MPDAQYLPALTYLQTLFLGFVQGLTEFLPVSSTAHMRIIPALLHWPDPGAPFSAIVQLGPIVAIIAYFRRELIRYVAGIGRSLQQRILFPPGDTDARLGWFTVLGTVPLIVFGLALEKKVDNEYRNLYFVAAALIVLAVVLLIAESRSRRTLTLENLSFRDAMIIGLAQALAIVPGASRSGCTITAGLFVGLDREDAARFSFLLSIPAITLAGLYKLAKALHQTAHGAQLGAVAGSYLFGALIAGVVAYVVIKLFLGYLENERHTTMPFIIYRMLLGVALLVLVSIGFVVPESH
ncbi:MAG: undecaprenyl-diphosphatase UppP [Armatimonadetes bacterium]|nr:undecaprenyl-diphosphatase UppP [Armatimonadota bacterium]